MRALIARDSGDLRGANSVRPATVGLQVVAHALRRPDAAAAEIQASRQIISIKGAAA